MFENGELNRQTRAPEILGQWWSIITVVIINRRKRQMAIDLHIHGAGPFDDVVAWASNGQTFLHQSRGAAGRRSVADGHLLRWQQLLGRLLVQTGSDVQKTLAVGWRVGVVVAVTTAHHHLGRPVKQTENFRNFKNLYSGGFARNSTR